MGYEIKPAQPEMGKGVLYSLDKDGTMRAQLQPVDISNGTVWSLDNTIMYYIDSIPKKLYAFDYDISTGGIS